jgi:hypothetical protein
MNTLEFRQRWLEALTSGEYEQGIGHLKGFDNHFCCLGVACDLYIKAELPNVSGWEHFPQHDYLSVYNTKTGQEHTGYLPQPVEDLLDIPNKLLNKLVCLNDEGHSFESIAAYLKEYFSEEFFQQSV